MLKQLYIRNFTLIDTLDIEFGPGFSVITGETGAGKSIILGAIGLLLGQRADSKTIKSGADKCVIEAHFDLSRYGMERFFNENDIEYDPNDCIIRRELTAAGKSRAFINDTPAPLSVLKELGEQLVDVHSQHKNLLVGKQDFQLNVVDIIAQDDKELTVYQKSFSEYKRLFRQLQELKENIERDKTNADFLQFQYDELSAVNLKSGEQEELEQRADTMSHAEEIKSALYETDSALSADMTGVVVNLKTAINSLQNIGKVMPVAGELAQRMTECHIELKDISQEVSGLLEDTDFNPAELDAVNNRLDRIYELENQRRSVIHLINQLHAELRNAKEALDGVINLVKGEESLNQSITDISKATEEASEAFRHMAESSSINSKDLSTVYGDEISKTKEIAREIMDTLRKRQDEMINRVHDLEIRLDRACNELQDIENRLRAEKENLNNLERSKRNAANDMEYYRRKSMEEEWE